ncbi:hypothetical protein SAMN05216403_13219 [Nitrosospira multiformis ATCC 25196]|uniref:Uncharacterized protein n=1 Tax=Nitrosospira multiformis (strain ATCC 25196 / NCIMB 11849 / C 71) TaxID=323848 RepID=A0A1H5XKC5_NITMU|nr:hypothetical protein SAMN05216403_13219 [Nitrosospira multiformis ATCC 25196]
MWHYAIIVMAASCSQRRPDNDFKTEVNQYIGGVLRMLFVFHYDFPPVACQASTAFNRFSINSMLCSLFNYTNFKMQTGRSSHIHQGI